MIRLKKTSRYWKRTTAVPLAFTSYQKDSSGEAGRFWHWLKSGESVCFLRVELSSLFSWLNSTVDKFISHKQYLASNMNVSHFLNLKAAICTVLGFLVSVGLNLFITIAIFCYQQGVPS